MHREFNWCGYGGQEGEKLQEDHTITPYSTEFSNGVLGIRSELILKPIVFRGVYHFVSSVTVIRRKRA
jgi:hypothetical protein